MQAFIHSKEHLPTTCAVCSGTHFIWGGLMGGIRFTEIDPLLTRVGRPVRARVCDDCGNLQLFTSRPRKTKRKKR